MELQLFKALWGHSGSLAQAADEAIKSGFIGLKGNADLPRAARRTAGGAAIATY